MFDASPLAYLLRSWPLLRQKRVSLTNDNSQERYFYGIFPCENKNYSIMIGLMKAFSLRHHYNYPHILFISFAFLLLYFVLFVFLLSSYLSLNHVDSKHQNYVSPPLHLSTPELYARIVKATNILLLLSLINSISYYNRFFQLKYEFASSDIYSILNCTSSISSPLVYIDKVQLCS